MDKDKSILDYFQPLAHPRSECEHLNLLDAAKLFGQEMARESVALVCPERERGREREWERRAEALCIKNALDRNSLATTFGFPAAATKKTTKTHQTEHETKPRRRTIKTV